jgi:transposase-like protein
VSHYTEAFKGKIVQRLLLPGAPTARALSQETGIPQSSLSRWVRDARKVRPMASKKDLPEHSEPPRPPRRTEDWTAEERLRVVNAASRLSEAELGALLRREGLHQAQLDVWRDAVHQASLDALQPATGPGKGGKGASEARRIRELEKQLRRKDKALAEAAALLVLSKKVNALWGDGDDDTNEGNDK